MIWHSLESFYCRLHQKPNVTEMGGWVVLPFNNSTLLCKCAKIIWCTEKISAPMGRVKTLKGEQLSIVVRCPPCTPLYIIFALDWPLSMIFFISYQTFAQKKENLSIRFDMVAMLRLVLSMFFFYPRQWHTDFWCSQFLLSFLNRILFFFQVLWRTLWKGGNCFHLRLWWQPLQVFIVHKDWEIFKTFLAKIKIRNKCEMLRAHCGRHVYQVGGICFFLKVAPLTSLNKCGVCKMMLVERCFCLNRLLFYLSCQRIAIALQGI